MQQPAGAAFGSGQLRNQFLRQIEIEIFKTHRADYT
jgi:hypothetical protein